MSLRIIQIRDAYFYLLCCRFGDYVSDQVAAPVRETCAQALGAVLKYMHPTLVHDTLKVLLQMQVEYIIFTVSCFSLWLILLSSDLYSFF